MLAVVMLPLTKAVAQEAGPREAYLEFIQAIRDNDAKSAKDWPAPGEGREDALLIIDMLLAGNAFQDALAKRFGDDVANRFPGQSDQQIEVLKKNVSDPVTKVRASGENATISRIPEKPGPITPIGFSGDMQIKVRKHDGKWKQVFEGAGAPEAQRKMMQEFVSVLTEITTKIESDKELTEQDVAKEIEKFRPPRPQR
jgi:hypothetical protein